MFFLKKCTLSVDEFFRFQEMTKPLNSGEEWRPARRTGANVESGHNETGFYGDKPSIDLVLVLKDCSVAAEDLRNLLKNRSVPIGCHSEVLHETIEFIYSKFLTTLKDNF